MPSLSTSVRCTAGLLVSCCLLPAGIAQPANNPAAAKAPVILVTDLSWEVSAQQTKFGEYPLSAQRIPSATSSLHGGTAKVVAAEYNPQSKIIPGSLAIWRNPKADGGGEAYQFRKTLRLGPDPIRKATLEINCDDVARIYINKRLASAEKRDGTIKDGWDDWYTFRSVSGFTYNRIYTYDVTDYFFTNVANTILIEAVSLAFDGSHAYVSAKITIEFGPLPTQPRQAAAPVKPQPPARPNTPAPAPQPPPARAEAPSTVIFEAGRDPEIEKLRVGTVLELGQVYFKADDFRLDAASYPTLDALVKFLKRHPGLKIEIGGHTNLRPTEGIAAELSLNRARSVRQYLVDNGIPAGRMTFKGYGKSRPRVKAFTPEAHRQNQRVEVTILEK
ncbi:MAG: OmpA family protein [Saprospiraceae bacterium]|nr:OmpA family protein [Saprospiraceae bacterium]